MVLSTEPLATGPSTDPGLDFLHLVLLYLASPLLANPPGGPCSTFLVLFPTNIDPISALVLDTLSGLYQALTGLRSRPENEAGEFLARFWAAPLLPRVKMLIDDITDDELNIFTIIERVVSVFSLLGCIFIIATFCTLKSFHKPINRLVFYASMYGYLSPPPLRTLDHVLSHLHTPVLKTL